MLLKSGLNGAADDVPLIPQPTTTGDLQTHMDPLKRNRSKEQQNRWRSNQRLVKAVQGKCTTGLSRIKYDQFHNPAGHDLTGQVQRCMVIWGTGDQQPVQVHTAVCCIASIECLGQVDVDRFGTGCVTVGGHLISQGSHAGGGSPHKGRHFANRQAATQQVVQYLNPGRKRMYLPAVVPRDLDASLSPTLLDFFQYCIDLTYFYSQTRLIPLSYDFVISFSIAHMFYYARG